MSEQNTHAEDHPQFDEICARVEDHEPLPTIVARPNQDSGASEEERTAPLDELILAGLVSPY